MVKHVVEIKCIINYIYGNAPSIIYNPKKLNL
jgi:hypothetical protein